MKIAYNAPKTVPGPAGELKRSPYPQPQYVGLLLRRGEGKRGGEGRAPSHTFWLRHRGEGLRDKDGRGKKGEVG